MKRCTSCHERKHSSDFYGHETQCKRCRIDRQNQRRRERKAKARVALVKDPAFSAVAQQFLSRRV